MFLAVILPLFLVISPGVYEKDKISYECYQEGIYRFGKYPKKFEQRIVYNGDFFKLLESITWLHLHGFKDAHLTDIQKLDEAKTRKLTIACGDISRFTKTILNAVGIQSRVVHFLTLEKKNSYCDGHYALEVFHEGKWILVDVDTRCLFTYQDRLLNVEEMMNIGIENVTLKKFSNAPLLSYGNLYREDNGYDYDFTLEFEERFLRNDIHIWYNRVCQSYSYSR